MQDISAVIRRRRNIKPENFSGELIDDSLIEELLENANWAPTHGYTEPWRFFVHSGEGLKAFSLAHAEMYKAHSPDFKPVKYDKILNRTAKTSHLIAIGMQRGSNPKIPQIEEIEATAAAVQNIWLSATAHGIACYWGSGGMTYHTAMKAHFGLSAEEDLILGFLYLGRPEADWPNGRRIGTIESRTHWIRS